MILRCSFFSKTNYEKYFGRTDGRADGRMGRAGGRAGARAGGRAAGRAGGRAGLLILQLLKILNTIHGISTLFKQISNSLVNLNTL